jgi:hypothetical protein
LILHTLKPKQHGIVKKSQQQQGQQEKKKKTTNIKIIREEE